MLLAIRISGLVVCPIGSKRVWLELVHQDFERNAVLQRNRCCSAKAIHQATDRTSFLGHGDEDFTW